MRADSFYFEQHFSLNERKLKQLMEAKPLEL